jgi:hypothetical protein
MTQDNQKPIHKQLVLDDGYIQSLALNSRIVSAFPFFAKAAGRGKSSCGACGGNNHSAEHHTIINTIKNSLVDLSDDNKRKLKQLLSAERVEFYRIRSDGQVSVVRF